MKNQSQARKGSSTKGAVKQSKTSTSPQKVKKTPKALMETWQRNIADSNQLTIDRLCEMSGWAECQVMRDVIEAAMPALSAKYRAMEMFNTGEWVMEIECKGNGKSAMGFKDGMLVVCDGKKYRPISLRDSLRWYARANSNWSSMDSDEGAVLKWVRMIINAL